MVDTVQRSASASTSRLVGSTQDAQRQASARNPISLRLYKILGTRCDDPATREALQTVYDLYRSPDDSRLLLNKGKVSSTESGEPTEDQDPPPSVPLRLAGAGFAARARKHLRHDAELKLAQESRAFLNAFQNVDQVRL